ncbi:HAD family hydrolase [Methanonatronarchaeum sp. AMET6-2]|uniref:HAD family hydrolase n=1 Tax=Methanonatronarchaeum sp. AMET6-2 TaxID=2933293 RepID=UPI0012166B27|nr:HAD family hydrolase [Methanonatronarchaeum sp. AMET6-2]RZN63339.1 MAG: HAD family hydrolase [Methanonatronarchaeia archaeon]UOY10602.1 HAD family hydrolase [Methanonatronarchaeum sp. AMET6-2]
MVRIISFDADGTLFRVDILKKFWFREVPRLYAQEKSIEIDKAVDIVKNEYREIGPSDIRWYLPDYWFDRFGLKQSPRDVIEELDHEVSVYGDARDALLELDGDYELIIVSNSPNEILETQVSRIDQYFDDVFSAVSDFKKVKDNPEVYNLVCQELGVEPSDVLHVGDNKEHDFEVPRKIGMNALHLDRYTDNQRESRIKSLRELLNQL